MKHTGRVTLPYTFCLFLGVLAIVLLMAGTVAWQGYRGTRAAAPAQAVRLLRDAIAPISRAMTGHFDPPVQQLSTVSRWAANGILPENRMRDWPSVVLPAVSAMDAIDTVWLVMENRAWWRLERLEGGWSGMHFDPSSGNDEVFGSRWDDKGIRIEALEGKFDAEDPRMHWWYLGALALEDPKGESSVHVEAEESTLVVSSPLRFSDGQSGCVAFALDCTPVRAQLAAAGAVQLHLDPGGARIGQIQDPQTLTLLRERALPQSANAALGALFPAIDGGPSDTWYAADAYAFSDRYAWWVIGVLDSAQLPLPGLPLGRYLTWALGAGCAGSLLIALLLGRRITQPLQQVAARAESIQNIDEHYVPWPKSRFTEVNVLTAALEEMYEAAVEHLDYHDAPLVVWAHADETDEQMTVDAEAVRHVVNIPRAGGRAREEEPARPVIDVTGGGGLLPARDPAAAAQIQALHGTRREVRRLQSQLAGAQEELRSTDSHYQQDQARIKRQRKCLRGLERVLLAEGGASPTMLAQLQEVLGASRVSVWIAGPRGNQFHLRGAVGSAEPSAPPITAPFTLQALLQAECVITVQEPATDPRLRELASHPFFRGCDDARMLAPIKFVGRLLGFILAERSGSHQRWKGDEELFVVSVAALCSGVVCQQLNQRTREVAAGGRKPAYGAGDGRSNGGAHALRRPATQASPMLYWETDRAGCIKAIEGDVEALYGQTPAQLIGQPITFLSDMIQGQRDMERLSALLSGAPCRGYETRHRAADGTLVTLFIRGKARKDANDHVVGARGTAERVAAVLTT